MPKVVIYVRVSTDAQAEKGTSLEAQEARCRAYAALYGLDVAEVVADPGFSAKTLKRPGMARVEALLKASAVDGVLVAKLDRLTRSVRDLGHLVETYFAEGQGKALFSVGDQIDTRTAGGRLVLNVLMSVAQWERETISERQRTSVAHRKATGAYVNPGRVVYAPDAVTRARELRAEGLTVAAVAERLSAEGIRTSKGTPLTRQQAARLLAA